MMRVLKIISFSLLALVGFGSIAGWLLVKDNRQKSDAIVVLDGNAVDIRFNKGLELLRAGYGNVLFLDAKVDRVIYGHTPAEYADHYVHERAGDLVERVKICPTEENSTVAESKYVASCMATVGAKSGLIVTSEFHTRRALSVFLNKSPEYHWTVAAANDPDEYGRWWWKRREWAKTFIWEWQRVLWWNAVDRWRN